MMLRFLYFDWFYVVRCVVLYFLEYANLFFGYCFSLRFVCFDNNSVAFCVVKIESRDSCRGTWCLVNVSLRSSFRLLLFARFRLLFCVRLLCARSICLIYIG